tara:strand:+ start:69137 stop:70114 length:978 start_codon:yes stop_codon:yes gene_type:complete
MASSPHDALFRYTFGKPAHVVGLLRSVLPESVLAGIDWRTLRVVPGTQVDEQLRRSQSDLVFSVERSGQDTWIYILIEHKRRPERWALLQLLGYVVGLWQQQRRTKPAAKHLPAVLPILLLQVVDRDSVESLKDLQDPDAAAAITELQPQFRPFVMRLSEVPLQERRGLALTLQAKLTVEALLRLPGAKASAVAALMASWSKPVARLARTRSGGHALRALWSYLASVTDVATATLIEIFEETMDPTVAAKFKPPSEQWRDEGRREGRHEGRHEGRREMLRQMISARFGSLPENAEALVASASVEQLDVWAIRVLDATSVADVFGC